MNPIMSLKPTTHCHHSGAEAMASGAANACPICLAQKLSVAQALVGELQEQIAKAREELRAWVILSDASGESIDAGTAIVIERVLKILE